MWPAALLAGGVYLQMILGAFVAGLRAGRTFNTWPLMDGKLFPDGYFTANPAFHDLFETMAAVQFNHRIGAYLLTAAAIWFFVANRKSVIKARAHLLLGLIGVQVLLGIWTVVAGTPLWLGLAHQLTALCVFGAALYAAHGTRREVNLQFAEGSTMSISMASGSSSSG
jgi:cytochrome c oxidase assembly protein subunit 15